MEEFDSEFLDIDRHERVYRPYSGLDYRPAKERIKDFEEIIISY